MKTKISKTQFAKQLKSRVKEYKKWYQTVHCMNISDEAKELFFSGQANQLLDDINSIANMILKNFK